LAIDVITASAVVDAIAVAHVEPVLGAVPPDRVLDEPREDLGKFHIELSSIYLFGDSPNDVGTTTGLIARGTIKVVSIEAPKNARANHFVLTDGGRGIPGSVRGSFPDRKLSDADAISWAMEPFNTTRQGDIPGGLGSKLLAARPLILKNTDFATVNNP
jgi:hypothetical protein